MVRLYTAKEQCTNVEWIQHVGAYFDTTVTASKLSDEDLQLMKKLEDVELVDRSLSIFKSSEGAFPINFISTGLKTLLVTRILKRQGRTDRGVDVTGCGPNVLDYVFEEVEDGSIPIVLRHVDVMSLRKRDVSVNDEPVLHTMSALSNRLLRERMH